MDLYDTIMRRFRLNISGLKKIIYPIKGTRCPTKRSLLMYCSYTSAEEKRIDQIIM